MRNKQGFAEAIILLAVLAVFGVLLFIFLSRNSMLSPVPSPTPYAITEDSDLPSPSPVSDSTDTTSLEEELNATVTGSVETDIDSMTSEANSL